MDFPWHTVGPGMSEAPLLQSVLKMPPSLTSASTAGMSLAHSGQLGLEASTCLSPWELSIDSDLRGHGQDLSPGERQTSSASP